MVMVCVCTCTGIWYLWRQQSSTVWIDKDTSCGIGTVQDQSELSGPRADTDKIWRSSELIISYVAGSQHPYTFWVTQLAGKWRLHESQSILEIEVANESCNSSTDVNRAISPKILFFIIIALGMRSKKRSFNEEYSNGTVANYNSFFAWYYIILSAGLGSQRIVLEWWCSCAQRMLVTSLEKLLSLQEECWADCNSSVLPMTSYVLFRLVYTLCSICTILL